MKPYQARIAFYLPALAGGGAEKVFTILANTFVERGYRVDLVANRLRGPCLARVSPRVRLRDLGASRSLRAVPRLAEYLRRERPTALLSAPDVNNVCALWARVLAMVKTRIIVSVHTPLSVRIEEAAEWQHMSLRYIVPLCYRWADGIVCVSDGVAADLARTTRISRSRITRIYNPIEPPGSDPPLVPLADTLSNSGKTCVLAVGRLTRAKDFPTLLRAFAIVRRRRDVQLWILGEGEEKDRLESLAKSLGVSDVVHMPGYVADPYPYMRSAAVVVASSVREGFGNVLVEAMACGVPVVSTDCPSGPREILDCGTYGILVPAREPEALADAIESSMDNPSPAAFLRARAEEFNPEKIADQYLALLLS